MKKIVYSFLVFGALSNFYNVYGDEVKNAPAENNEIQNRRRPRAVGHGEEAAVQTDIKQNTNVAASKIVPPVRGVYPQLGNPAINENQNKGQSEASNAQYPTTNYNYSYCQNQQPAYGYQQQYPNQGYGYTSTDAYSNDWTNWLKEHFEYIEWQNEMIMRNTERLMNAPRMLKNKKGGFM